MGLRRVPGPRFRCWQSSWGSLSRSFHFRQPPENSRASPLRMRPAAREVRHEDVKDLSFLRDRNSQVEEVGEELFSCLGQDRLRMELHTFYLHLLMTDTHDEPVRGAGRDFQAVRQRRALDDQRVVARGRKGIGEPRKDGLAIMGYKAGLAVHDLRRSYHPASERLADRLVPEAHAQDRYATRKRLNN